MKAWKRIACAALAMAMLLATGCTGANARWAYRAGDIQPPVGVYIFYMVSAASEAEEQWDKENPDNDEERPAYKERLKWALKDGRTVEQFVREKSAQDMRQHIAVEYQFAEKGLELPPEQAEYARNTAASSWQSAEESYTDLGIAEASLREVLMNQLKREQLFQASYGASGEQAVPDAEIETAFKENFAQVDMMYFHTGEAADTTAAVAEAEAYQKRIQAGENIYNLIYEYDKKQAEASEDATEVQRPAEGSRSAVLSESARLQYGDTLVDAALTTPIGETVIATEGSYVYLLQRGDVMEDPSNLSLYRNEVVRELKDDEFEQSLETLADSLSIEVNQAAIDRYPPTKLKVTD